MEEKGQNTQLEQETKNVVNQAGEEAKSQPNVEELQRKIEEDSIEDQRKEKVIQKITRERDEARRRSVPPERIEALSQEIKGIRKEFAGWVDDLEMTVRGERGEELPTHTRKTRRQQIEEDEKKTPKTDEKPRDPDVDKFFDYLTVEELDFNSDFVQDAIKDTTNPKEAIKAVRNALKNKAKGSNEQEIEKLIESKANEKARILYEEELKKTGMTASGASAPNVASSGDNKLKERYPSMFKNK